MSNANHIPTVTAVLVPSDEALPLRLVEIPQDPSLMKGDDNNNDDRWIQSLLLSESSEESAAAAAAPSLEIRQRLLVRPSVSGAGDVTTAGLYAYECCVVIPNRPGTDPPQPPKLASVQNSNNNSINNNINNNNIRATRLAMACGLFEMRFTSEASPSLPDPKNVLLVRQGVTGQRHDLTLADIYGATAVSPDLRPSLQAEVMSLPPEQKEEQNDNSNGTTQAAPQWLSHALQNNYHDRGALTQLSHVMLQDKPQNDEEGENDNEEEEEDDDDNESDHDTDSDTDENENNKKTNSSKKQPSPQATPSSSKFVVTRQTLCLHCRRPATTLCPECQGCYFCNETCQKLGWTHQCQCPTWKVYAERRRELSTFPGLGDWTQRLTAPALQSSEQPYQEFLNETLGLDMMTTMKNGDDDDEPADSRMANGDGDDNNDTNTNVDNNTTSSTTSWWSTEVHGWAGGMSRSAQTVDVSVRKTFAQGLAPLSGDWIPPPRRVQPEDIDRVHSHNEHSTRISRNSVGLLLLNGGWEQYYQLRNIPTDSPVALLATFPLTVYHAIARFGEVPCTVAQMLERPLRVHIVGTEKEANFLDLFAEVGYLLPEDFSVELTFIVREDMLPPKCRQHDTDNSDEHGTILDHQLCPNLSISVVAGTYGDSLDPNFGIKGGAPDMILGLNAGLYAYESWRSVVEYLHVNPNIVAVFTDYNEHSGVNCASLGGAEARCSLEINPFRQPRASPVYSMNLPQFSNGFFYVMNAQELE